MTYNDQSDPSRQGGASMTSSLAGTGRETLETVKSQAMDAVSRTTEAARSQALSQAETAKDTLADTGERLAQSLRSAVDGGDDSIQARLMSTAADGISEFSNSLRGRSLNDLWGQVDSFARRNPGAFVAAAALAGFALARFARSSSSSASSSSYGSSSYGSSQYGGMGGSMGSGMGSYSGMGSSSGMGSGMGSGGDYAGSGGFGVGTGMGYGAGRVQAGHVNTSGMTTHGEDLDDGTLGADALTEDTMGSGTGLGGGLGGLSSGGSTGMGAGTTGTGATGDIDEFDADSSGTGTSNSSSDSSRTGYDRGAS